MARQMKTVTTEDVREWARNNSWTDESGRSVGDRGRLSSSLVSAYNQANKRYFKQYGDGSITTPGRPAAKVAEKASVTPMPRKSQAKAQTPEVISAPVRMLPSNADSIDEQATAMVAEVVTALRAAAAATPRGKTPTLVTVSAHTLV